MKNNSGSWMPSEMIVDSGGGSLSASPMSLSGARDRLAGDQGDDAQDAEDEREPEQQRNLPRQNHEPAAGHRVVHQRLAVGAVEARPRDEAVGEDVDQPAEGATATMVASSAQATASR